MVERHEPPRPFEPTGFTRDFYVTPGLERAAASGNLRTDAFGRAQRFAHSHRLLRRFAQRRGAATGSVRIARNADSRERPSAADLAVAVAGASPGSGHPRSGQLL